MVIAGVIGLLVDSDEPPTPFTQLRADQQVYDTGTLLTAETMSQIDERIDEIEQVNEIEIVTYTRGLEASSDETLDQVAALQEEWSAAADVSAERTVAILINVNPGDPEDARAGIYAGEELVDDLLTEDDQADIVEDALIPPLTEGDTAGSLLAGLDQLAATLSGNATPDAFERWASDAGRTWVPWVSLGVTLLLFLYGLLVFNRRTRATVVKPRPTTVRPDDFAPAVGGALALGGAAATALPATIIDLAGRGVLALEPEGGPRDSAVGADDSKADALQIVLLDESALRGPVDRAVWKELSDQAQGGVVKGKALTKASQQVKPVMEAVRDDMMQRGWIDAKAPRARRVLGVIAAAAGLLAMANFVVLIAGQELLVVLSLVAAIVMAIAAVTMIYKFSLFSEQGQQVAVRWQAYRHGLQEAIKDPDGHVDVGAVLPDLIATGQSAQVPTLLEEAGARGDALAAFAGLGREHDAGAMAPLWTVYSAAFIAGGVTSAGTVTGTVGGSGGGAAGST